MNILNESNERTVSAPNWLIELPYVYRRGDNPCGDNAYYNCHCCGIEMLAEEVGFISAGATYANGEFAPCPSCGEVNPIDRDDKH